MDTIKLYIDYISQPSRTVLCFCLINQIPIQIVEIRIAKLQHHSDQYAHINPMKKVPAIFDQKAQITIGQSHAILRYLIKKFKLQSRWYPKQNVLICAKIDQYLDYHHQNTRKCAFLIFAEMFSKLYNVDGGNMIKKDQLLGDVQKVLDFINENYFKESSYLIGKQLTIADISAFFQIDTLNLLEFELSKWKKIEIWLKIMREIEGVKQTNKNYTLMIPKLKKLKSSL